MDNMILAAQEEYVKGISFGPCADTCSSRSATATSNGCSPTGASRWTHDHVPLGPALRSGAGEADAPPPAPLPRAMARRRDLHPGQRAMTLLVPGRRRHRPDDRLPTQCHAGQEDSEALLQACPQPEAHP